MAIGLRVKRTKLNDNATRFGRGRGQRELFENVGNATPIPRRHCFKLRDAVSHAVSLLGCILFVSPTIGKFIFTRGLMLMTMWWQLMAKGTKDIFLRWNSLVYVTSITNLSISWPEWFKISLRIRTTLMYQHNIPFFRCSPPFKLYSFNVNACNLNLQIDFRNHNWNRPITKTLLQAVLIRVRQMKMYF